MTDLSQSVCLNHPDTPAVARCATCSKPICEACVVNRNDSLYCSEECAANAAASVDRITRTLDEKRRTHTRTRYRTIILLLIILIAAAAASWYYFQNKSDVDRLMQKTGTELDRKVQETKNTIQQGIPTSSQYKRGRENLIQ